MRLAGRGADALLDLRAAALHTGRRLDAAAATAPIRDVLVLGVYVPDGAITMAHSVRRLEASRHRVRFALGALGRPDPLLERVTVLSDLTAGKLANVNRLAERAHPGDADWVLLLDDDVDLGPGFLDRLLHLAEAFGLQLAQPALRRASHTAWEVTRRRPALVRETRFVEMGPCTLMTGAVHRALSPFPEAGMGWGVDLHWAAVAQRRGWRVGVVDAVPVRHDTRPTASTYRWQDAIAVAHEFLARHEHLRYAEAERTLATHTRLPPASAA